VLPFEDRFPFQAALYQLDLLATLVGIGRAALAETVAHVRARERNYSHAKAARVRDDPQAVVTDLVLQATSDLFDTLGASATARTRAWTGPGGMRARCRRTTRASSRSGWWASTS
jgi:hypothetical protein